MNRWTIRPGEVVELDKIDTRSTAGAPGGESSTGRALSELSEQIASCQERQWAEHTRSLLVVLQAMDTGGKDSTIRDVFSVANPLGVRVTSFRAPSPAELEHDFLWRVHRAAPGKGWIGVFNRSHYEDVTAVRVLQLAPESVWRARYALINDFERQLAHGGTVILKFFLHISKQEQAERLQERLDNPNKHWKFNPSDLDSRRRWSEYMSAYEEAINRTSTETAPWHVIPADHKWYRKWAVAKTVATTLRDMDPQYPEPVGFDPDLKLD